MATTYVEIRKGYRLVRQTADGPIAFLDRLIVGGIKRVVSHSVNGIASLDEIFGVSQFSHGKAEQGSPLFAPSTICIDASSTNEVISQFTVLDTTVEIIDPEDSPKMGMNMNNKPGGGNRSSMIMMSRRKSMAEAVRPGDLMDNTRADAAEGAEKGAVKEELGVELDTVVRRTVKAVESIIGKETLLMPRPEVRYTYLYLYQYLYLYAYVSLCHVMVIISSESRCRSGLLLSYPAIYNITSIQYNT